MGIFYATTVGLWSFLLPFFIPVEVHIAFQFIAALISAHFFELPQHELFLLQVLKGVCLEILNSLFYSHPPPERLSADLNAKIITVSTVICCINIQYILKTV